jgi:hypothetical protein
MNPSLLPPVALIIASVILTGCLGDGSSSPDSTPVGVIDLVAQYRLEDGKIVFPPQLRTRTECLDETKLETGTFTTVEDWLPFEVRGDTLLFGVSHPQEPADDASVQLYDIYMRVGSGSGLKGQWTLSERIYRVESGNLAPLEHAIFDRMTAGTNVEYAYSSSTLYVTDDSLKRFTETRNADIFVAEWNGVFNEEIAGDSSRYDIAVRVVDNHTVEMEGAIDTETVRIIFKDDGSRTYASTAPGHTEFHYDRIPAACPNHSRPDWYRDFLESNRKPIPRNP